MSSQVPTTSAPSGAGFTFDLKSGGVQNSMGLFNSGGGDADSSKHLTAGFGSQPIVKSTAPTSDSVGQHQLGNFSNTAAKPAETSSTPVSNSLSLPTQGKSSGSSLAVGSSVGNTNMQNEGFANLSTATKTTNSSSVANCGQLTYNQLEEYINKWTLEFEEQEKVFTEQATQINAWDKILINNNQKILDLNEAVQKVKSDQQLLEQELEFIATQHKELEESINPLQKEFTNLPQVDVERCQTYLLVENLDTQLKQMSEDLKEIIDNLNESNKGQDNTDPIIQIGKILNAHMSSLQWIESSSTSICNKLDDINKMLETQKRDAYRSAYYNLK